MPLPRCVVAESLDELAPGDPQAQRSRRDLRRIHRAMGSLGSLKHALGRLSMARRPATLIEIGAGDGSLMLRLARALGPAWSGVQLTLLDRQRIVDPGTLRAFEGLGWRPTVACEDALEWARAADGTRYDLCVISLFLHHFDDASLEGLLEGIARRSDAVIAIEPRRDALAAVGSRLVAFLGANAITRGDAIKSVAAGFTAREISARWPTRPGWWTDEFHAWPFSHVFLAIRQSAREEAGAMTADADVLIIGAGPAGAAAAIFLAQAGWHVVLVEQSVYPRQKVCGECLTAGGLAVLDELGVGALVREHAGPELREIGWSHGSSSLRAQMPPCTDGPYPYGRALGRDRLDAMLGERAAAMGITRIQPAKVRAVRGLPGAFICEIEPLDAVHATSRPIARVPMIRRVPVVIDAHGSWEAGPWQRGAAGVRPPRRGSDLFGFKASFRGSRLPPGLLPVLAFPGGYGGMVIADGGRLTLAGCIRRDTLGVWRARIGEASAGLAFEKYLRHTCREMPGILDGAARVGHWLSVGPLRPGIRTPDLDGPFLVGNAAAETHPLIGEGISMALQSARILANRLAEGSPRAFDCGESRTLHLEVNKAWRDAFAGRMHLAAVYSQIAMRPALALPVTAMLRCWPPLLTRAAQLAGKSLPPIEQSASIGVSHEHA